MNLTCEHISVQFAAAAALRPALEEVTLRIPAPARIRLQGGAGSGKTTLLKVLAGLIAPSRGVLRWNDRDVATLSRAEKKTLQAQFGMIFQTDALFDSESVMENVSFPLLRRGVSAQEAQRRSEEVLEAVGLRDALGARPEELSGGMRKRVGIARALVARPSVLLADDPHAGLDPGTAHGVTRLLAEVSLGRTFILVSEEALPSLGFERVLTLRQGKLSPEASSP